jgi:hypothetical protein
VFVPASFIADGGLIDRQYPVSGGNDFRESGKKCPEGPDQPSVDIAMDKTTLLTHGVKLVFRGDIFHVLISPTFANPSNDVLTPSTFGVISAQYGLNLEF